MLQDNDPQITSPLAEEPTAVSSVNELYANWSQLTPEQRFEKFRDLPRLQAEDLFLSLKGADISELLLALPHYERRAWIRLLPPDDAADAIQQCPLEERNALLDLLDDATRREVMALLAYAEDDAGGLMSPRYARVRSEMTVDEAISYLRKQAQEKLEFLYYVYVLDGEQRLVGVVSVRELLRSHGRTLINDMMLKDHDVVKVQEQTDQETVGQLFSQHGLVAIPVVDQHNHMKGVVTIDDIVDVVQEEATEDIQKIGATEALQAPYLQVNIFRMIRKRGLWLAVLFVGEMFTATAMGFFQDEIAKAVVLALFIPLIISSGGNSGSQASTLIIRAMALGEVRLRDWWRVVWREIFTGVVLGTILGFIGLTRILLWPNKSTLYGDHYVLVSFTVAISLIGVVTFGTIAGSMLPFILKKLRFDPAIASAPLVATLVDVSGLVIYFFIASLILRGTLL
jgi:magnesium transporter